MTSNYPLPSKASLLQQFVGKTLYEIPLPAAVIDRAVVKRNCQRMSDALEDWDFDLVPAVNIHKTTEITRLQIGEDPEQVRVLVTTLSEAENLLPLLLEHQKNGKQVNVLYGVPVAPSQVERIANLAKILGRRGGNIRLLVQHASQIPLLQQIAQLGGYPIYVYINVDVSGGSEADVTGVRPGSQEFQDLFTHMERIIMQEGPVSLMLPGFYCHHENDRWVSSKLLEPLNDQLSTLLNVAPVQGLRFSVNASPAILYLSQVQTREPDEDVRAAVETFRETLAGVVKVESLVEVHDSAYPLMDLNAISSREAIGFRQEPHLLNPSDIALTILTEVSCVYTRRGHAGDLPEDVDWEEALISIGSSVLGQGERKLDVGKGMIAQWNMTPMPQRSLDAYDGWRVETERIAPECSVLRWHARGGFVQPLRLGQRLRVYPKDAKMASESFGWYVVVDSSRLGREDEIVDIFVRWRG
ncbi:hypothetical protein B0O99DRAFT_605371 [Bisporella sp. PMI_857]|nr:hypothetical protein B0O99DRAFT_605371 [Bisporella sp. PMI_857]